LADNVPELEDKGEVVQEIYKPARTDKNNGNNLYFMGNIILLFPKDFYRRC